MRNFHYRIEGFSPPEENGLGRWGFAVILDPVFATRCLNHKLDDKTANRFTELARETVSRIDTQGKWSRLNLADDTLLLRTWSVPGDCACMGIDGNTFERLIKQGKAHDALTYNPHNVDSQQQAVELLAVFLMWCDYAEALLST